MVIKFVYFETIKSYLSVSFFDLFRQCSSYFFVRSTLCELGKPSLSPHMKNEYQTLPYMKTMAKCVSFHHHEKKMCYFIENITFVIYLRRV